MNSAAMTQAKQSRWLKYSKLLVLVLICSCVGFLLIIHQKIKPYHAKPSFLTMFDAHPKTTTIYDNIGRNSNWTATAGARNRSESRFTEKHRPIKNAETVGRNTQRVAKTNKTGADVLRNLGRLQTLHANQTASVGVTIFAINKLGLIKDFRERSADPPLPIVIVCDGRTDTEPTGKEVEKYLHTEVTIIGEHSEIKEFANIYLLTFKSQSFLFPRLHQTLPKNSSTRKVMGYLLAYSLGAIAMWDFDAEATLTPTEGFLSAANIHRLKNVQTFTIASHTTVTVNPLVLMGATLPDYNGEFPATLWPRGTPLTDVTQDEIPTIYETRKLEKTASIFKSFRTGIVQSIINGSTDSSSSQMQRNRTHVDFPSRLESVAIHPAQFAPSTSLATLVYIEVLWTMYLPTSVVQEVADIWRGYIAQALMRCSGYLLVYTKPLVSRPQMSEHNDVSNEQKLDTSAVWKNRTELLIRFLQSFRCTFESPRQCLVQVYEQLSEKGIMMREDVTGVKAWVESLKQAKYVFTAFEEKLCSKRNSNAHHGMFRIAKPVKPHFHDITSVSSNDTLLVVHINHHNIGAIPLWKAVWQHFYAHPTVFYIPDMAQCRSFAARNLHCISDDERGYCNYESQLDAVQRYPGHKSYVSAHDDLVMNPRLFGMAVSNQASMITDRGSSELFLGRKEIVYLPTRFKDTYTGQMLKHGVRELMDTGDLKKLLPLLNRHCPGEKAYYFPFKAGSYDAFVVNQKDVSAFITIMTILRKHEIFLESAIPWALHCGLGAGTEGNNTLSWRDLSSSGQVPNRHQYLSKALRTSGATSWNNIAHSAKLKAPDKHILGVIRFRSCMQDFLV